MAPSVSADRSRCCRALQRAWSADGVLRGSAQWLSQAHRPSRGQSGCRPKRVPVSSSPPTAIPLITRSRSRCPLPAPYGTSTSPERRNGADVKWLRYAPGNLIRSAAAHDVWIWSDVARTPESGMDGPRAFTARRSRSGGRYRSTRAPLLGLEGAGRQPDRRWVDDDRDSVQANADVSSARRVVLEDAAA